MCVYVGFQRWCLGLEEGVVFWSVLVLWFGSGFGEGARVFLTCLSIGRLMFRYIVWDVLRVNCIAAALYIYPV